MDFVRRTIELAMANVEKGGRPFACTIVKDGTILAEGVNRVAQTHDPTAHAEIVAIREAAANLQSENFTDQVKPVSTPLPHRFGLPNFSMW
jgi:guanine deaminase